MTPSISIVVSTYEWPEALEVLLGAIAEEREPPLEVLVADDGSGPATAEVIERIQPTFPVPLAHAWQADDGWRKSRALNLAASRAGGEYLLVLDGDSLPRRGFLRATRRAMLPGWCLASKRLHLSKDLSRRTLDGEAFPWRWSTARWLLGSPREVLFAHRETGGLGLLVPIRDRRRPWRPDRPDFAPPFGAYGFYFGVWREDFERVNGFDMRFTNWGGEDRDIAARLRTAGIRCGWPGADTTMLHLWHTPMEGTAPSNAPLVDETVAAGRILALNGIRELEIELAHASANRVGSSSPSSGPVKR